MHPVALTPPRITLEEWAQLPEDVACEWIDGTLIEEEVAGVVHEIVVVFLATLLRPWALASRGWVAGSNVDLAVSRARGRRPDVCVFRSRRPPPSGLVSVPPDLIVEVVSPNPRDARRDRVEKLQEYAAFGVSTYWIVDPAVRTFEVFELGADGRYVVALSAAQGRVMAAPGLEIDLDALWSEVVSVEEG